MALLLNCNGSYTNEKGKIVKCGQTEVYLDPKTDQVFCPLCNQEVVATHFNKMALKNLKQYRQKSTDTFSVKCQKCGKEAQPVISQNLIICPSCKTEHKHLSDPFKIMLKDKLKTANQDVK